ncbi:hypothetical protein [Demequina salsinemoris]|uniref:hypothetical protein n=1 Tax=Demequina salsinemoris TaxID=577470 RepID=UPI000784133F|nr:hypothetical protein [Demequina salsinemoris]
MSKGVEGTSGPWRPRRGRILIALCLGFPVLCAAAYTAFGGVLVAGFGWPVGFVMIAGALVVAPVALTMIARRLTGARRVAGAVAAVVADAVMLVAALAHFHELPMVWVPAIGIDVAFPVIGAVATLVWGAFLGGWTTRVLGGLAGVGVVIAAAVALQPEPSPYEELMRTPSPEEAYERYADGVEDQLSTDAPGVTFVEVHDNGVPISIVVADGGGVVEIRRDSNLPADETDRYPCWYIAEPNADVPEQQAGDPALTAADYSDRCERDDAGWRRVDGSGYARPWDGGYVFVYAADEDEISGYGAEHVEAAGGSRPANADEVAAVLAGLRPLTDAEIRIAYDAATPDEPEA